MVGLPGCPGRDVTKAGVVVQGLGRYIIILAWAPFPLSALCFLNLSKTGADIRNGGLEGGNGDGDRVTKRADDLRHVNVNLGGRG